VWTCRDPISLILGTRFSILGIRIGSLKHLKKYLSYTQTWVWEGGHEFENFSKKGCFLSFE